MHFEEDCKKVFLSAWIVNSENQHPVNILDGVEVISQDIGQHGRDLQFKGFVVISQKPMPYVQFPSTKAGADISVN